MSQLCKSFPLKRSLKATALAATLAVSPLVLASGVQVTISSKDSLESAIHSEVTQPGKVHIVNNDMLPAWQDMEFSQSWLKQMESASSPGLVNKLQPDQWQKFRRNQAAISEALEHAQATLSKQGRIFEQEKEKAQKRHNEIQEQYNKCATDNDSWADNAAGVLGFFGVVSAIFGSPAQALALVGSSCGTYFISGVIKQMEMNRLQTALKQNEIEFDTLNASASIPSDFKKISENLQRARFQSLHNIALINNGDILQSRERRQNVEELLLSSRFRHMQLPLQVNSEFLEGELYGPLVSQSDDDVFVLAMGDYSNQTDNEHFYKILRNNNQFYIAVSGEDGTAYLEFESAKGVLGFFRTLTRVHNVRTVSFINLDPMPEVRH